MGSFAALKIVWRVRSTFREEPENGAGDLFPRRRLPSDPQPDTPERQRLWEYASGPAS